MAKRKSTGEEVAEYFEKLDHPLKDAVQALRNIVLTAGEEIGEQIKWNSPSFCYTGKMKDFDPKDYKRDIVVFNLHKKDAVLLVFPTGAKVSDKNVLLEGKFTDGRKTATFRSLQEVEERKEDLQLVVKEWLKLIDK